MGVAWSRYLMALMRVWGVGVDELGGKIMV